MDERIRSLYEIEGTNEAEGKSGFRTYKRKEMKKSRDKHLYTAVKKMDKQLKRHKKRFKKVIRAFETSQGDKVDDLKKVERGENIEKVVPAEKSFWRRLGDAVVKAVPAVLTTLVTSICGFFFRRQLKGNFRTGWSAG